MYEYFVCMYMPIQVSRRCGNLWTWSNIEVLVSRHVGAENQIWILCKNNKTVLLIQLSSLILLNSFQAIM